MLAQFVLFIVAVCDNLFSMASVSTLLAATIVLVVRISQRKPFPIHIFDDLGDRIEPTIHKGATVLLFACFCLWGGNKIIDNFFDTYIELSCLFGIIGIALGVLFWRMWQA
jgi:hypothetical protein